MERVTTLLSPSALQNRDIANGRSEEITSTTVLFMPLAFSLNTRVDLAHVGVSRLGTMFRTLRFPAKSARPTSLSSLLVRANSGATAPLAGQRAADGYWTSLESDCGHSVLLGGWLGNFGYSDSSHRCARCSRQCCCKTPHIAIEVSRRFGLGSADQDGVSQFRIELAQIQPREQALVAKLVENSRRLGHLVTASLRETLATRSGVARRLRP